jgi:hypothetical protein
MRLPTANEAPWPSRCGASGKDHVEIVFSDDGCGMNQEVRRKAFDPFFTMRRDQGSTGLGLHIVHSIVTNYLGGRIGRNRRRRLVRSRFCEAALKKRCIAPGTRSIFNRAAVCCNGPNQL